jgi:tetratricopeptide (TPR) repeat protein
MTKLFNLRYEVQRALPSGKLWQAAIAADRVTSDDYKRTIMLKTLAAPLNTLSYDATDHEESEQASLARCLQWLASVRHPNLVSWQDYGFTPEAEGLRPYRTTLWIPDVQHISDFVRGKTPEEKYALFAQMMYGLACLHRRGILHRNLKPANVVVADERVKIMDFGIAQHPEDVPPSQQAIDTVSYMAPELFRGADFSVASDLYAAGLLLYEILAERFPYQRESTEELLTNISYFTPDIDGLNLPNPINLMLLRLLSKTPEDRYQTAIEVLEALQAATGQPLPEDYPALREVYLHAAHTAGRDREQEQLKQAVEQAATGAGSAWLISGESGIGKTRLARETAIHALAMGFAVIYGAAEPDSGVPYDMFQPLLRTLALLPDLSGSDQALLLPVVNTLNAEDDNASTLPEKPGHPSAFHRLVVRLLTTAAASQPVMLILENLHDAGLENIALVREITAAASSARLVITATARQDATTQFTEQIPGMTLLALRRLNVRYISELTQQILGAAGELPIVNALLFRETEGNLYFLLEVMRTLAEQVGDVGMIGIKTLPEQLFAGGINDAVNRRLDRVPEDEQDLMLLAALLGMRVQRPLLERMASPAAVERWLLHATEVSVLEVLDGDWHFAHERLHAGVLRRASSEQLVAFHARIAQVIEPQYTRDFLLAAPLARHYEQARNPAKEQHYRLKAGETALYAYAPDTAVRLLEKALTLTSDDHQRDKIMRLLTKAQQTLTEPPDAPEDPAARVAEILDNTPEAQMRTLINLGTHHIDTQAYDQAVTALSAALPLAKELADKRELARLVNNLAGVYLFRGDYEKALLCTRYRLDVALLSDDLNGVCKATGNMGLILSRMGRSDNVERCYQMALTLAQRLALKGLQATYTLYLAHYYLQNYLLAESLTRIEEAATLAHEAGPLEIALETVLLDAYVGHLLGVKDESTAITQIQTLVASYPEVNLVPVASYWAWKINNDRENDRKQAASAMKDAYQITHDAEMGDRYYEMTKERLPAPAPLPDLPPQLSEGLPTVDDLIARVDKIIASQW